MARREARIDDRICGSRILICISALTSRGAKIFVSPLSKLMNTLKPAGYDLRLYVVLATNPLPGPNRSLGSLGTFVRFELSGYGVRVGECHPWSIDMSYIPRSSHL